MELIPSPASRLHLARPWLITWGIIYFLIIVLSLFAQNTPLLNAIKVGGIFLCFVYAVTNFPHDRLLILALFFTCLADTFLAFSNTSIPGLIIFVVAQLTHLIRLDWEYYHEAIILFSICATIVITLALIFQFSPPIYAICAFYGVTLTLNLMASWRWKTFQPRNPHARLAFLGFLLFACCDIWTGVSYLSLTGLFSSGLYPVANFFAWIFYYPSQILISNSAKCATIVLKEGKR